MKILFILILVSVGLPGVVYGKAGKTDREEEHPIDRRVAACLVVSENQTTAGMVNCAEKSGEEWDQELNRYYKLLMAVLSAPEKDLLREAQRKWLAYRDSEYKFSGDMYTRLDSKAYTNTYGILSSYKEFHHSRSD